MILSGNEEIDPEGSEVAMENFAALRESSKSPLKISEVASEYTIAIQESPGAPFEVSEVATAYTIVIQESPRAASRPLDEQGSVLRLHLPVPEDFQSVCKVHHSKSTSATSGGSWSFGNRKIDSADD
ncbi:hypothetical protein BDD12DRAFT_808586 [Trichophaea hybrida]|nr:hypothetical protein BDD12DRAFT_808586 [Trichophaea hybrida]